MALWRLYYHLVWATKNRDLNHLTADIGNFGWQAGYGVFSLGRKQLDQAIAYVQNQKIHHAEGTIIKSLEQEINDEDGPDRWFPCVVGRYPPGK
jgi:hypothetical protein